MTTSQLIKQRAGLHHGGRLLAAAKHYNIPLEQWLDLSTGINPNAWPVPTIPGDVWSRLPEENDGLEAAARDYYGAEHLLPVAGSQAAIQALPLLRTRARVAVLNPAYAEHAHAWKRAGHEVTPIGEHQIDDAIAQADVLILVHPNNPTGARFTTQQLLTWHKQLSARGGWLIVDEAFMDSTPEHSLCQIGSQDGLIILRSLGKFFGLAGIRVGFVCAQPQLLEQLHNLLGPWSVNAPARWVATKALQDKAWQQQCIQKLNEEGAKLNTLLTKHGFFPTGGCTLFQWILTPRAEQLHKQLAQEGVFTRLFTEPASLRFGLPKNEAEWQRLEIALVPTE
ncbi:threonine-phosphate decarboxylase CobD [Pseudomonadota bacterium]